MWHQLAVRRLAGLLVVVRACCWPLVLATTWLGARGSASTSADEITIVFCGSKKSLASGVPMASVLFAGAHGRRLIVLPLMLFHQIQLMVCAVMARRYAREAAADEQGELVPAS